MRYLKDPNTGKRISRMNPKEQWVSEDVPALRIVEQSLWDRAQSRLAGIREASGANNPDRPKFWESRRAQHLLTGKLFCAGCGGALTNLGRDYLACGAARKRGTCSNTASLRRSHLEAAVIAALRSNLMEPSAVQEFIAEFTAEWNRLVAESNAERAHDQSRLTTIERKISKIIEAVMEGFRSEELKQQLEALSQQKAQLQARLSAPATKAPSIHPHLAELYRQRVEALQTELAAADGSRGAVLEALRDLIERVDIGPAPNGGEPEIILTGALAAMVRLGLPDGPTKTKPSTSGVEGVPDLFNRSVKVVAGTRDQLDLLLLG